MNTLAEEPIDPVDDTNNLAIIRARAALVAESTKAEKPTSLETGYLAVYLSLVEAANQVRYCAARNLTAEQMVEYADRLDALAANTIALGEAVTEGGGQ